jgi:hypothetical protein
MAIDWRNAAHHDLFMRLTVILDTDVAIKAKEAAARLRKPFNEVVDSALRIGLDELSERPLPKRYRTTARPLGLRHGLRYDDIAALLARAEGQMHS